MPKYSCFINIFARLSVAKYPEKKERQLMYRTRRFDIKPGHPLEDYCRTLCSLSNNLYNAAIFRQRQMLTARGKDEGLLTENEREVLGEVRETLAFLGKDPAELPGRMPYSFLEKLMRVTSNPDFFAPGLPRQSAQHVLRTAVQAMDSFFAAIRAWKKNPAAFTGRPELPGYRHKGGLCTTIITNQDGVLYEESDGSRAFLKLPLTKMRLSYGPPVPGFRLKNITICPANGIFTVCVVTESETPAPEISGKTARIAAVDFGVNNFMAVTNNVGAPCLLYKGGAIKSVNRMYNKTIARIVSGQTAGGTAKFVPTPEYHEVVRKRNHRIHDFMLKAGAHLMRWCVEQRIDTIVLGKNGGWKQGVAFDARNAQNFVQIPYTDICRILIYLGERNGIRVQMQEESYTSQASFRDSDVIPTYGGDNARAGFSGKRGPTEYHGARRPQGFRGLYQCADGTFVNSDLNGSANIGRKAFPELFNSEHAPDFEHVVIIRHPEQQAREKNRKEQRKEGYKISRSRQRRMRLKRKAA